MRRKILLTICLLLVLLLGGQPVLQASADAAGPVKTCNQNAQDYSQSVYRRWAFPVYSHLMENGDGTLTRVEYTRKTVTIETFSEDFTFIKGFTMDVPLPIFGGFYGSVDSNFLVFGQENPEESGKKEVIRIVRYTKDWKEIGTASLYGANTTIPFEAGSLRFAEYNGYLYIRTAHEMYTTSDGLNHQANLTLNVRIADMEITDAFYNIWNSSMGYVSHSFNQFIAVDEGNLVAMDHGDAHPRSIVLFRYFTPAGQDEFSSRCESVEVLPIAGQTGDNNTGVAVGGFECSDNFYLAAGSTVEQKEDINFYGQRNIFITATNKYDFSEEGTFLTYLTSYPEGTGISVSNPHLVKLTSRKFAVLWTEGRILRYTFINETGDRISDIYSFQGGLSDCKPIVYNGKIVWYVTNYSEPVFYAIDPQNPYSTETEHSYQYTVTQKPTASQTGMVTAICSFCKASGDSVTMAKTTDSAEYELTKITKKPTCTQPGAGLCRWLKAAQYGITDDSYETIIPATGHNYVLSEDTSGNGILVCTHCGDTLQTPLGDIDCNFAVNRDDVIALLLHITMPDAFPISVPADFNGDGAVSRDDVIRLLLHVTMPEAFPLTKASL